MATDNASKRAPRWISVVGGLLISGALLVLVLAQLDLEAAWARTRAADPGLIGWALLASLGVLLARGLRFWALTLRSSVAEVTAAVAAQNFLLRVTPLRAAELTLPWFLARASGEPAARSLIMLVLVRLVELWVVVLCAALAWATWFGVDDHKALALLGVGAAVLLLVLIKFRWCMTFGLRIARQVVGLVRLDGVALVGRILDKLDAAAADGAQLSAGRWLALSGTTVLVSLLQFVLYGCLVFAFGLEPDPRQLVVGVAAAQISGSLPVLTVGSVGTHEAGWIAGFALMGVSVSEAALTAVATQVITLGFAAVFVGPAWLYLNRRRPAAPPPP